jgi:hypothetical protein
MPMCGYYNTWNYDLTGPPRASFGGGSGRLFVTSLPTIPARRLAIFNHYYYFSASKQQYITVYKNGVNLGDGEKNPVVCSL